MTLNEPQRNFEAMYAGSYGRLVGQLTVITGNPQEAQDAVQEALFRAWAHWDKIGTYDDPVAWVRRVAINLGTSRWRKLRRLVPLSNASESPSRAEIEQLPDALDLIALVGRLPRREREALVLFYLVDLPISQVADSMGLRIGSVKALLSRGRQRLHQLMQESESEGKSYVE